jgi:uncharacterized protein GlcG (DUF336 family)
MPDYIETPVVTIEAALRAVNAGLAIGAERGIRVMVTVVDPSLNLVAFAREDGATPHSVETSRRKATTAASTRKPSGSWEGDFAWQAPLGTGLKLTNIAGGVPLVFGGVLVGGLGIAGGPPAEDAAIAHAVLAAIGADPV